MALSFWGPLQLMNAALPHMQARKEGRLVNITAAHAMARDVAAAAAQHALFGLSNAMRNELAIDRVCVTTVSAGSSWPASGRAVEGERAAARVVEAMRYGDPSLTLAWSTKAAAILHAVAPNVSAQIAEIVAAMQPRRVVSQPMTSDAEMKGAGATPINARTKGGTQRNKAHAPD
jgi:NAD(P)-dependent dehydrogenase (short-subunit alcohol dehydrogenase family)